MIFLLGLRNLHHLVRPFQSPSPCSDASATQKCFKQVSPRPVCVHTCTRTYAHAYLQSFSACVHMFIHMCIHACICKHTYSMHTRVYQHMCTHAHSYVCAYTHPRAWIHFGIQRGSWSPSDKRRPQTIDPFVAGLSRDLEERGEGGPWVGP